MSKEEVTIQIPYYPLFENVIIVQPYSFLRYKENGYYRLQSILKMFESIEDVKLNELEFLEDPFTASIFKMVEKDIERPITILVSTSFPGLYIHPRLVNPIASYISPYYLSKIFHPRFNTDCFDEDVDDDVFHMEKIVSPYHFLVHHIDNYVQLESILSTFNLETTVQQVLNMSRIKKIFQVIQNEMVNKFKKQEPLSKIIKNEESKLVTGTYVHPYICPFISGYLKPEILLRMAK